MHKVSMSVQEASRTYGVSDDLIYQLIGSNTIAAKRAGRKYLIPVEELEAWYEALPDA